jgi:hypothetical protein
MTKLKLPETVRKVLVSEASRDFEEWLETVITPKNQPPAITPLVARQKVNGIILDRISDMLVATDPEFVKREDGRQIWRVPIFYTSITRGRVGQAGELDIDAQLGKVIFTDLDLDRIRQSAKKLAQKD